MAAIGVDLILFALTAALFTWLKQPGAGPTSSLQLAGDTTSPLKNSALVFIKPHANTIATQELVRQKLGESGITILSETDIDGKTIDREKKIDQHYYAIASKATIIPAKDIPVPADKFQDAFGESWDTVLSENRACNAVEACNRFGCDPQQLSDAWDKAKKVVKFGGGFYCGLVTMNDMKLYVFNAFFMKMRAAYVTEEAMIHCFEVEWNAEALSWSSFRNKVLGPTDPAEAPRGSLRRMIRNNYKELGLEKVPNKSENAVHASASPFEGLAEKMNWLGKSMEKDQFGKALLGAGLQKKTLKEWSLDPRIGMDDGALGSVFDALEELDAQDCLARMVELNDLNS